MENTWPDSNCYPLCILLWMQDYQKINYPKVRMIVHKLFINNQRYFMNMLHSLPESLQPATIFTPMNHDKVVFFSSSSTLSNNFVSPFRHKGECFNCDEQFIMVEKARFCRDQISVKIIMEEMDPVKQKQIGKWNRTLTYISGSKCTNYSDTWICFKIWAMWGVQRYADENRNTEHNRGKPPWHVLWEWHLCTLSWNLWFQKA